MTVAHLRTSTAIEVDRAVLAEHDLVAAALRRRFVADGTYAVNLVSSPGTGKTASLTQVLLTMQAAGIRAGALVGDCATNNDAVRLAASGAPVQGSAALSNIDAVHRDLVVLETSAKQRTPIDALVAHFVDARNRFLSA